MRLQSGKLKTTAAASVFPRKIAAGVLIASLLISNALFPNSIVSWGRQTIPPVEELRSMLDISAGDDFNIALKTGGRLIAWGSNNFRQTEIPEIPGRIIAIDAGARHVLVLQSDGKVIAWGNNRDGQTEVPEGLNDVVAISAGESHSLALRSDGSIIGWGSNRNGQLDIPGDLETVAAISAGRQHSLALLADGSVIAWGSNSAGQSTVPEDLGNIAAISAGGFHNLALLEDGRLIGWGDNDFGQISIPEVSEPIERIEAGVDHNLMRLTNGEIIAWGRNHYRQTNIPSNVKTAERIAAGADHSIAIFNDGSFTAWGRNNSAQAMNSEDLTSIVDLSVWGNHTIALREDGTIFSWGAYYSAGLSPDFESLQDVIAVAAGRAHGLALKSDGRVIGWGDNIYRQATPPADLNNVVAIAAGEYHSIAVRDDGEVFAWGSQFHGQTDVPSGLRRVVSVAGGREHSLALTADGLVFAWGDNFQNQLQVPSDLDDVIRIAAGSLHNLALRRDGTIAGWGSNIFGQIRIPDGLSDIVDIDAGQSHTLAIRENRNLIGWGGNYYRQSEAPENLDSIIAIAAGNGRTIAVTGKPQPPRFISQFQNNISVPAGEDLFIMPRVSGTPPLIFQWMKDGKIIENARGPALSLRKAGADASGSYSLVIANRAGNSSSQSFNVEINDPSIRTSVAPEIAALNEPVTFTARARGTEPFSLRWMKDGEPIPNATETNFRIDRASAQDAGNYSAEVSNEHGTVKSEPLELLIAPEITRHPPPNTIARIGERLVLEIEAAGSEPLEIQWLREGIPLSGENSPQLVLNNIDVPAGGIYSAIVRNRAGSIRSEPTSLQILPHITFQPESQIFSSPGGTAIFDVRAIGTPPLTYLWLKDGEPIQETDDPRLVLEQVSGKDGGDYSVVIINPAGEVESESAPLVIPPFIAQHPRSQTVRAGSDIEFRVEAEGKEPFEFQWLKNGEPIPGETRASLKIENAAGEDSGRYSAKVTNEIGNAVSQEALLSISPQIISEPEGTAAKTGSSFTLFVEAEGSRPLHYQWTKDGNSIPDGNNPTLTLEAIDANDQGTYSVIVSNAAGIAISKGASIEIIE